jgi:hypothetical protein
LFGAAVDSDQAQQQQRHGATSSTRLLSSAAEAQILSLYDRDQAAKDAAGDLVNNCGSDAAAVRTAGAGRYPSHDSSLLLSRSRSSECVSRTISLLRILYCFDHPLRFSFFFFS